MILMNRYFLLDTAPASGGMATSLGSGVGDEFHAHRREARQRGEDGGRPVAGVDEASASGETFQWMKLHGVARSELVVEARQA